MTCHNCKIEVAKFGFFGKERIQRYKCKQCGKTFADIPVRPLDDMRVPVDKAVQILGMLVEGMSVRGAERLSGVHRDTILRLLETAAQKAHKMHDSKLKRLHVGSVQVDECWTRVRVRQANATREDEGDQYAFLGMCRETKLIIGYHVGKRTEESGFAIMGELNKRIHGRFQLTSDAFAPFRKGALTLVSNRADYATQTKVYDKDEHNGSGPSRRYAPPRVVHVKTKVYCGTPYPRLISTSHAERQNLSVRHFNKRFTRLTLGYSKKVKNLWHAVALFVAHYNFCRVHSTLGKTPAMASKLTDHQWTIEELLNAGNVNAT